VNSSLITLHEASVILCKSGFNLSQSQHDALNEFIKKVDDISKMVNIEELPELLKYIWDTLLSNYHQTKKLKLEEKDKGKEKKSMNKIKVNTPESGSYYPDEIMALFRVAKEHVPQWRLREQQVVEVLALGGSNIDSLVELARKVVLQNINGMDFNDVPPHILDEVLAPVALGRSVIQDFLACFALQKNEDEAEEEKDMNNKVTISTIHKAKGLEWSDVYVPYLNEGFLPTIYRNNGPDDEESTGGLDDNEDNAKQKARKPRRHISSCSAREGGRCDKNCTEWFQKLDDRRLGDTAEERHLNEERRLAHVAATRAKNRLVFTSFDYWDQGRNMESQFYRPISQLSESVIATNKDE
jgi:superfamily I DNA/RNA helicase